MSKFSYDLIKFTLGKEFKTWWTALEGPQEQVNSEYLTELPAVHNSSNVVIGIVLQHTAHSGHS